MNKPLVCILGVICTVWIGIGNATVYLPHVSEKAVMVHKLETVKGLLDSVQQSIQRQIDEEETVKKGKCAEALAKIDQPIPPGSHVLTCDDNGNYRKKQCYSYPRPCYCVDTLTGERTPEWGANVTGKPYDVNCEERKQAMGKCAQALADYEARSRGSPFGHLIGESAPQCDENGNYRKKQCPPTHPQCYCVDTLTGERTSEWGANVTGRPYDINCDERKQAGGKCAKEVSNWDWGAEKVPKPACDPSGDYARMQCPGRWPPRCYCVEPATGERLWHWGAAVDGDRKRVDCGRRRVKKGNCDEELAMWNEDVRLLGGDGWPGCDKNGNYKKVQCNGSTRYCWCVDTTTGQKIPGTSTGPSILPHCEKENATGKCSAMLANWDWGQEHARPKPTCDANGDYARMQCPAFWPRCYCVKPATGERLWSWGAPVAGDDRRVDCGRVREKRGECDEELARWNKPIFGRGSPACDANGNYKSVQCSGSSGYCWCVDTMTGHKIANTSVAPANPSRPVCDGVTTSGGACAKELAEMIAKEQSTGHPYIMGKPQCDEHGDYNAEQCMPPEVRDGSCRCVNTLTGKAIPGTTSGGIAGLPRVDCGAAQTVAARQCRGELEKWKAAPGRKELGVRHRPNCDRNGNYYRTQSDGLSPGFSWCVDALRGRRIKHSMRYGDEPMTHGDCAGPFYKGQGKCAYERARGGKAPVIIPVNVKSSAPYGKGLEVISPFARYEPACDEDGHYERRQCSEHYTATHCWCVRPLSGERLPGTVRTMAKGQTMRRNHCEPRGD